MYNCVRDVPVMDCCYDRLCDGVFGAYSGEETVIGCDGSHEPNRINLTRVTPSLLPTEWYPLQAMLKIGVLYPSDRGLFIDLMDSGEMWGLIHGTAR